MSTEYIDMIFEYSIIPEKTNNKNYLIDFRVDLTLQNEIWRVHKNDLNPNPSDHHAHKVGTSLKLHLGTGGLYNHATHTKKYIGRKTLDSIRNYFEPHIVKWGKTLPLLAYGT